MNRNNPEQPPRAPQEGRSLNPEDERTKEQVRMFLFQSKWSEHLPGELQPDDLRESQKEQYEQIRREQIGELQLTEMYLARRKSKDGEPDRLVPFGGDVDAEVTDDMSGAEKHGKRVDAGLERTTSQTHVRPTKGTVTNAGHTTFTYDGQTREVTNYTARLMPRDMGYALDPERNRIEGYVGLTMPEWAMLAVSGEMITDDGETIALTYNMVRDQETREEHGITDTTDAEVIRVQQEVTAHLALTEADKKLKVLRALVNQTSPRHIPDEERIGDKERRRLLSQIDLLLDDLDSGMLPYKRALRDKLNARDDSDDSVHLQYVEEAMTRYQVVQNFWYQVAPDYDMDSVQQAVRYTNMEAEVNYASEREIPRDEALETGKGNPTVDFIFPLLMSDHDELTFSEKKMFLKNNPRAAKLLRATNMLEEIRHDQTTHIDDRTEVFLEYLREEKMLHTDRTPAFREMSDTLDEYFRGLLQERIPEEDWGELDVEPEVTPMEKESDNEFFARLVRLASDGLPDDAERSNLVRWEAQRKLVLMLMYENLEPVREESLQKGVAELKQIEEEHLMPIDYQGESVGILALGWEHYLCRRKSRTKEMRSMLRKMIVRNEGFGENIDAFEGAEDVHGEAYIFRPMDPATDENYETMVPLDTSIATADAGLASTSSGVEIPLAIANWFQALKEDNNHIRIEKLKPLPKKGEAFVSAGAGGGDKIRMMKCDFVYVDDDGGELERREIQIFVPHRDESGEWISGEADYQDKKKKDDQYALKRLFNTRALRSFMELMYPEQIYKKKAQQLYTERLQ